MSSQPLRSDVQVSDVQSWIHRAQELLEQGQYEAALDYLNRITQVDSQGNGSTADNYVLIAVCLIHLKRFQAALESCDRALELAPDHAQAWLFRGVSLRCLGRFREAYGCYDRAAGQPSDNRAELSGGPPKAWIRPLRALLRAAIGGTSLHPRVH